MNIPYVNSITCCSSIHQDIYPKLESKRDRIRERMSISGVVVFLLFTLFSFPGAAYAQVVSDDYFILDPGASWMWLVTENTTVSEVSSMIADQTTPINNVDTVALEFSDGSKFFFSEDQGGYKIHRLFEPSALELQPNVFVDVTITLDPAVVFVGQVVEVGDTFSGSGIATIELTGVGSDTVPFQSESTFLGIDNVSVPAGDFSDTMHIDSTISFSGTLLGQPFAQVQEFEQWVGRSIGFVKFTQFVDGLGSTSELLTLGTFFDVPSDYWAFSFIETLAANGITTGCGLNIYCPENSVTRAQMAVFLERGINGSSFDPGPGVGNVFFDVPASYWAVGWIERLSADGITTGCGFGNYCPEDAVTREQMAVFLLRAKYGQDYAPPTPTGVFNDVVLSHWSAPWIEQLAKEGITTGCGPNIYCPKDSVTRAQMAVFLVRTFELE